MRRWAWIIVGLLSYPILSYASTHQAQIYQGRAVYEYYCYQCHGYAGDGQTLASVFVNPKPRDFTSARARKLSEVQMLDAVSKGRGGTAMVSFSSVLSADEIESVITYIRSIFSNNQGAEFKYHSAQNGWFNHEKYRLAFPFVTGDLQLNSLDLTTDQIAAQALYINACMSCHDQPLSAVNESVVWQKTGQAATSQRGEK